MDLMPSDEHLEIAATVSALLARRVPVVGLGRKHGAGTVDIDAALWQECCDLGWLALGLPEAAGGVGYSVVEEAVLFRELGRGLAPGPFLPGVLGAHVAAVCGETALVTAIATGATRVALGTPVGRFDMDTVSGDLSVVHAAGADLVVVCTPTATALFPASACAIIPIDGVDVSVSIGMGRCSGADAVARVAAAIAPVYDRALVLAAANAVGVAQGVLAVAVDYAKQRQQFGKAIGSYQAIKHPCADMAVRVDGAEAQVAYASVAVRDQLPGSATEAVVAKYYADEAARLNSDAAVQVHGAIGFTSEATPYRYVLRAHLLARCLVGRADLLDAIIGEISIGEQPRTSA